MGVDLTNDKIFDTAVREEATPFSSHIYTSYLKYLVAGFYTRAVCGRHCGEDSTSGKFGNLRMLVVSGSWVDLAAVTKNRVVVPRAR